MGRKKKKIEPGSDRLFEHHERVLERRIRRQRALFIPRLLREAAADQRLAGPAQDRAYAIAVRWADLESTGQLAQHKETSIDTQFLDQLFGEGMGYSVKTTSPTAWELEHKYTVALVGTADAAFGEFPGARCPAVVVELKDATTDLDRDRSNGRTAVQQCWDYLNALPECPWGIVSNFSTIRLYHRSKGNLAYEEFSLQELRHRDRFNELYCLFQRDGLLRSKLLQQPRAQQLLEWTQNRQKQVGNDLYKSYQFQRLRLVEHLMVNERRLLDDAIRIAQKLLDRIIFIAFCEDRELLPEKCLERAYSALPAFSKVLNPRWHNFLALFHAVDKGMPGSKPPINAFNGGLFAEDPEIDDLDLFDEPWTVGFKGFGDFDFSEEVNVEVLGHLFERSITELEKLRVGGLFALKGAVAEANGMTPASSAQRERAPKQEETALSRMPKSAQRKRFGIYYTPVSFTSLIVERTVDAVVRERFRKLAIEHGVDPESREAQDPSRLREYWIACLSSLKKLTICDPACGSGAFLIRAYDALDGHYKAVARGLAGSGASKTETDQLEESIPDLILSNNLFGVDLSREGVEITQLALWIRSARKGMALSDLSRQIVQGNSLVSDASVDPKAFDWAEKFPAVFERGGFDCVIGNPPWERVKLQEREFFSLTDPDTAQAVSAAERRKRVAAMPKSNPELYASYQGAIARAQKILDYARRPKAQGGRFPLTGKGDVNLYVLFAELARSIVSPDGMVGLLVPSGVATDETTKDLFNDLVDRRVLISLYDFENKLPHFEDVHRSFKFTALVFGGVNRQSEQADFVFFAHDVDEVAEVNRQRHIALTAADLRLLNPNTRTCPIFRTRRDADLTKVIYRRVPILVDEGRRTGGNPWGIKFLTMFHQTNDAEHFHPAAYWEKKKYSLKGNVYVNQKKQALPLYEAKMVQAFDHRAASVMIEEENWVRQGQKAQTTPVQHGNPEFCVQPRWWVDSCEVDRVLDGLPGNHAWLMGFKDITSPTNERTMIASFIPRSAATNKFVLMLSDVPVRAMCCLLGNFNSFVFDYVTRQKIGGITLNFFIVEQLPTLPPDTYSDKCPWATRETLLDWISERALKLTCTAEDMIPLAEACGFKGKGGNGVHPWKDSERFQLRAELDAAYFHLYGVELEDAEYMLSTFSHTGYIPAEAREADGAAWERGSIGEAVMDAYDALATLRR